MSETTWTMEDAKIQIGEDRFWECELEVVIEGQMYDEVSGSILFTHSVPREVFFEQDNNGLPKQFDLTAEVEGVTIEATAGIATGVPCGNMVEFVAMDADKTVEGKKEPTAGERTVRFLDDLACDIVDGEVDVMSISVSKDPQKRRFGVGWNPGPTTLEVVYDDE